MHCADSRCPRLTACNVPGCPYGPPLSLTTPYVPVLIYQPDADILSFVLEDTAIVARPQARDVDFLLSLDRTRLLGFQVHHASRYLTPSSAMPAEGTNPGMNQPNPPSPAASET